VAQVALTLLLMLGSAFLFCRRDTLFENDSF
jgi:hypothetical protein